ncbi:MAG: hypothetical protein HY722_02050 [Planctomycetes bacterium]|nr:hypothetical protein [Planctomycetota bacterium]
MPESYRYPLERSILRSPGPRYRGPIYTWDIDNTYLQTPTNSLRGLARTAIESADRKVNVPGAPALLKELRRGPGHGAERPVYFVSASPPQMRRVLEEKFRLDGIGYDGMVLKDQLAHVKAGRFRRLLEHVGFKLSALLLDRLDFPREATEVLFGDDTESDALAYTLYAEAVAGRRRGEALASALEEAGVPSRDRDYVVGLAGEVEPAEAVEAVVIHLARGREPALFAGQDRVVTSRDCLQTALALHEAGHLRSGAVAKVGRSMRADAGVSREDLAWSVLEAHRRGLVSSATSAALVPMLVRRGVLPETFAFAAPRSDPPPAWPRPAAGR